MRALTRFVLVAGLIAPVTPALSQAPAPLRQPESIPYELAAQLMGAGGLPSESQILVGSMPEWVSNRIVAPAASRVVGSAFIGNMVVAVFAMMPDADSAVADFRRELMKKGWINPPPSPANGFAMGGFRPAGMMMMGSNANRNTLCREPEMLTMSSTRSRGMAVYVTLRLTSTSQYSTCRPQPMPVMAGMPVRPSYPTLYNPSGVQETNYMSPDCADARFSGGSTQTNFMPSMGLDAILGHYEKQLQDSGWKAVAVPPTVAIRAYTRPDSTGKPVETVLTASTLPGQPVCKQVTMMSMPKRN